MRNARTAVKRVLRPGLMLVLTLGLAACGNGVPLVPLI